MTQTTKDEAERIEAYVATAKRITTQARQLRWFEWSQEQIEADIYAALRAARAEALEEAAKWHDEKAAVLSSTSITPAVYVEIMREIHKGAAEHHRAALKENEHGQTGDQK